MSKKKTKPRIELDLKQVETLAANGLTQQQIADALGISARTLYNQKKLNADFAEAIKKGKAKGIAIVTNKLMEQAKEGNTTAIIFFLKTQAGWKERQEIDVKSNVRVEQKAELDLSGLNLEELDQLEALLGKCNPQSYSD